MQKIYLLFHSFFQRSIPKSANLFEFYLGKISTAHSSIKAHGPMLFKSCFFWTLRIINNHITEKSLLKIDQRSSLSINTLLPMKDQISLLITNLYTDVLCVNEPKLDSTVCDSELLVNGYTFIRRNRTRHGAGLGINVQIKAQGGSTYKLLLLLIIITIIITILFFKESNTFRQNH